MAARPPIHLEAASSLALAMVASSTAPLLLLDGDMNVCAVSASFCQAFKIDAGKIVGQELFSIGKGEWNVPQLKALLSAIGSGTVQIDAYEMDLKRKGRETRCLVLNAQKLQYAESESPRVLLTISDVTDARLAEKLKDDLVREKAILLQEVQHRVANSLQIIASVLLQNARKVQSDETKTYLHEAHNRVMSVAAVQQQLAASTLEEVALRPYFAQLCQSLGASMIHDIKQLSVEVTCDDTAVDPNVSVSLGLIVTELVINSLKHAFPNHRKGKIVVDYQSLKKKWTLSVADNGVGMPKDPAKSKPGLGTSIVEALAHQLNAKVRIADMKPGTRVSIVHG